MKSCIFLLFIMYYVCIWKLQTIFYKQKIANLPSIKEWQYSLPDKKYGDNEWIMKSMHILYIIFFIIVSLVIMWNLLVSLVFKYIYFRRAK